VISAGDVESIREPEGDGKRARLEDWVRPAFFILDA
jgi:hypothetical protein